MAGSAMNSSMKKWLLMILLWAGTLVGQAAEIVAWKVPLNRYTSENPLSPNIQRCKAAPEASPFFKEGDELWDLKNAKPDAPDDQKLSLDWLVWNASSGQLVAKGHWVDISRLDEFLGPYHLPQHCRLTVNVCEVAEDGSPMVENAKPIATMSLTVKSGHDFEAKWSGEGKTIEAGGYSFFGSSESVVNVGLQNSTGREIWPESNLGAEFK